MLFHQDFFATKCVSMQIVDVTLIGKTDDFHFCEELHELLNHIDFCSFRQKHRFEQWT